MREDKGPEFRGRVEEEKESTTSVGTEFCPILETNHVSVFVAPEFAAEFLVLLDADQD